MPETSNRLGLTDPVLLNRRQVVSALGAAAGTVAVGRLADATEIEQLAEGAGKTKCFVRVAAVSYSMPFHDHRGQGVDLSALRDMTAEVAKERPDFICYPEICTCSDGGFDKGIAAAPELEPYVAEVAKIACEFDTAIVAPLIERDGDKVFNSVPIVDRSGKLVLNYDPNAPLWWREGKLELNNRHAYRPAT